MSIYDQLPPHIAEKRIIVSRGAKRSEFNWAQYPTTFGGLAKMMSKFSRGDKDGPCITGGSLNNPRRLALNVVENHLLMFDSDYGHTLDELEAAVRKSGYACLMYTTFSHLKTVSEIGEGAIVSGAKKLKLDYATNMDEADLITLVKAVLQSQDKIHPRIISSISSAERIHAEGAVIRFTHDPLPRARLVFILDEPYAFFVPDVLHRERINEWKDRYKGFAKKHKLSTDGSCIDPSRLMYLPRIGPDADESIHEQRWVDGSLVKFADVPRETDLRKAEINPFLTAASESGVRDGGQAGVVTFKTPGLAKFLKGPSIAFEAADWLRSVAPEHERQNGSLDKATFECPNQHNHSNPDDPNDMGFFAVNSSMNEHGWLMQCSHDTCKRMCQEATGRPNDRAWYLDLACEKYGITHTDELADYYDGWVDEEAVEEEAEKQAEERQRDEIQMLIEERLDEESDGEDVDTVLREIAKLPHTSKTEDWLEDIAEATGRKVTSLRPALATLRRETKNAKREETNTVQQVHPIPADPSSANVIWDEWEIPQQLDVTRRAFARLNHAKPRVFIRPEGGMVRVRMIGTFVTLESFAGSTAEWAHELGRVLSFKRMTPDGEERTSPFPHVVMDFVGANDIDLPVIKSVSQVPVYAADGTLVTENGYNEKTQTWLHTTVDYLPVPKEPTGLQVDLAWDTINEPLRDFPFSDAFDGSDNLPIRSEEIDVDGFPLPNWERGKSSRLHVIAMMLQPFIRNMIVGSCPIYHIDKSAPGTGAGYLVDVTQIILTGERAEIGTMNHNEEEFRKEITAKLRSGSPTIFLDNINHHVDDGNLAGCITGGSWKGRILGKSEEVKLPITATWIMAGNNLTFSEELMRRICPIRLDADVPDPAADRPVTFYKHKDIHKFCNENRIALVNACHVLVQNWIAQGMPIGSYVLQSFNGWSGVISGIFEAAGVAGFMSTHENYRESKKDDATGGIEEFIEHMHVTMKGHAFTVQEAYAFCLDNAGQGQQGLSAFASADPVFRFPEMGIRGNTEHGLITSLGKIIKKIEGRTFKLSTGDYVKLLRCPMKRKPMFRIAPKGEINPHL